MRPFRYEQPRDAESAVALLSERPGAMFKPWSPMSLGAWALFLFGGIACLAFL